MVMLLTMHSLVAGCNRYEFCTNLKTFSIHALMYISRRLNFNVVRNLISKDYEGQNISVYIAKHADNFKCWPLYVCSLP